jgi:hypothetical protein
MDLTNKAELKRVWLEALRSGEYKQTRETLHNPESGGFCCLGVAAKVWGIANEDQMGEPDDISLGGPRWVYDILKGNILTYVIEEGIHMNDHGSPFTDIADMIERDWVVTEPEQ